MFRPHGIGILILLKIYKPEDILGGILSVNYIKFKYLLNKGIEYLLSEKRNGSA